MDPWDVKIVGEQDSIMDKVLEGVREVVINGASIVLDGNDINYDVKDDCQKITIMMH